MDMIDRAAGSKYGPLLAASSAAIIIFIFEPLSRGGAPGFDASVFAALGHMISEGYVLYRDMIDIKGPGIFLADAAFISLGGFRGIAIAEAAAFFAGTLSLIYAARRLSLSGAAAASALFLVLPFYLARYFYGNMTEDWAFSSRSAQFIRLSGCWGTRSRRQLPQAPLRLSRGRAFPGSAHRLPARRSLPH